MNTSNQEEVGRWVKGLIDIFEGKEYRNLIPLCHTCHEEVHGYRKKGWKKPLTEERW